MTNLINDTRLAETNENLRKLGRMSASSALAKPQMALAIAKARADGILTDADGEATYEEYLKGRRDALKKNIIGAGAEDDGGSHKANVSKNTQILKAAGLASAGIDFVDVMTRATTIRADLVKAGEKVKAMFEVYVDCARAQLKDTSAALTDEAITVIAKKKERAEKELVDKLVDLYKRAHKLAEEFDVQSMRDTVDDLKSAIVEAGGEVPAITKEEKAAAEATAFLAKQGFTADQIAAFLASKATSNV